MSTLSGATSEDLAPVRDDAMLLGTTSEADLLVSALARHPARLAIRSQEGDLTYAALADRVSQFQQALERRGFGPGSRIGVLSANRVETLFATYALGLAGACLVPLHPRGSIGDHAYVARDADLDALIFDPTHYEERTRELTGVVGCALALGPSDNAPDLVAEAASIAPRRLRAPVLHPDQVIRISYSGGTTGEPKGIIGTPRTLLTKTMIQLTEWEWPAEVRQLICAPLSHAGAAMLLPTLIHGGSVVVMPAFDPGRVLDLIERERITCVLLVPTMIASLLDHPDIDRRDLSSLEAIYYGAAPISTALLKRGIARLGQVFFQFYGQTEAPMTVCVMRRDEHDPADDGRLASCGRPVPWVRVSLRDDAGEEVRDGEPGELCVQGPLLMGGYWNKPEQTAEALAGGWLHSGDIAVRRPDGFLAIIDRKKDMIISGGFNVFAREIEAVIEDCAGVAACAVIGTPDEKWGEIVTAVIVPHAGATIDKDAVIAAVRDRKGPVQVPRRIVLRGEMPLTGLGKPDKRRLRAELGV